MPVSSSIHTIEGAHLKLLTQKDRATKSSNLPNTKPILSTEGLAVSVIQNICLKQVLCATSLPSMIVPWL